MEQFNAQPPVHFSFAETWRESFYRQRRPAVDLMGMGVVRSDHWHKDMPLEYLAYNIEQSPSIYFNHEPWINFGIALSAGMYSHTTSPSVNLSVLQCWPSQLPFTDSGVLEIEWPGYHHTIYKAPLIFARNGRPVLFTELVTQIANIWYNFFRTVEREAWTFVPPGVPLQFATRTGVTFAALRLVELYSRDGITWRSDVGYVKEE